MSRGQDLAPGLAAHHIGCIDRKIPEVSMIPKTVRLPEPVWRQLEEVAAEERRSLNGQVLVALEQWLLSRRPEGAYVGCHMPGPQKRVTG